MPDVIDEIQIFAYFGVGAKVDFEKRAIMGFAVATAGPALGHDEKLDMQTLKQIVELGNRAPIRCRMDHPDQPDEDHPVIGSKLEKLVGFAKNFRLDGDVVRADCFLLAEAAAPLSSRIMALAGSAAAEFIGASMVHLSRLDKEKNVRVENLLAIDFVDFPAANPAGLFSVKNKGETNVDPLKKFEREGKEYVIVEGKEYEIEASKEEAAPAKEPDADDDVEQDAEEETGAGEMSAKFKAKFAKAESAGVAKERAYRAEFDTALTAGGITGEAAVKFHADFYGLEIKQVKFLAANALASRAKGVGEGSGVQGEESAEKKAEAAAIKRFDSNPQTRKLWTQSTNQNSEEYKGARARFVSYELKYAKENPGMKTID